MQILEVGQPLWGVLQSFFYCFFLKQTYCWWLKSCTSWYSFIPLFIGFQTSKVVVWDFWTSTVPQPPSLNPLKRSWALQVCFRCLATRCDHQVGSVCFCGTRDVRMISQWSVNDQYVLLWKFSRRDLDTFMSTYQSLKSVISAIPFQFMELTFSV